MNLQIPAIIEGIENASVAVSDYVFGQEYNEPLIHQLVVSYLAAARSGTKSQKKQIGCKRRWCKTMETKGKWSCSRR